MSNENRTEAVLTTTGEVLVKQTDGSFRKVQGQTDWKRLDAMKDEDIDYSDLPELDDAFFRTAKCVDLPSPNRSRASLKNPPHPGEVIRTLCLEPLGLAVTDAARGLGVTEEALAMLLNGHDSISPDMAIRLSKGFGGSPESWLRQQMQYDLAQIAGRAEEIDVKRLGSA